MVSCEKGKQETSDDEWMLCVFSCNLAKDLSICSGNIVGQRRGGLRTRYRGCVYTFKAL